MLLSRDSVGAATRHRQHFLTLIEMRLIKMCDEISLLSGGDRALKKKSILRGPMSIPFAEHLVGI
jgi:hypothetical protein